MPIALYDKEQNVRLFEITPEQRDQLVGALEEESASDRDYYIDAAVVDFLDGKVDAEVITKLRSLVGTLTADAGEDTEEGNDALPEMPEMPEGIDIEWREE